MEKLFKKFILLGAISALIIVSIFIFETRYSPRPVVENKAKVEKVENKGSFTYKGKTGKNALSLLKEKTAIELDKSGLVISINNRRVDSVKHEYWAFYVNGKQASVGPSDYQTKDNDTIDWKIEKY